MSKKKKHKKLPKGLPEKFLERLSEMFGESVFRQIEKTFVTRPTTFRVNGIKASKDEIIKALELNGFKTEAILWYGDAFLLKNKTKRELTELDIYKDGKIYIQSLASMIPPLILDPKPGERVLDLVAAPGSKTSQIAALMGRKGELVANDINKVRFFRLQANMESLGVCDTSSRAERSEVEGYREKRRDLSTKSFSTSIGKDFGRDDVEDEDDWKFTLRLEDGSALCLEYGEPYFDKILVDAICSSEARFQEGNVKTYGYWSERKIKEVAYQQQKLLMGAWSVLKPGGTLVYSTCTFAPEENESRVTKLLERHEDAYLEDIDIPKIKKLPILKEWRGREFSKEIQTCLRIFPTKDIEGFFVAKIRKK